ncbi:hypothetical protein T439DRAFT_351955 [Meredithblackwellia eburnea MCA 4105]
MKLLPNVFFPLSRRGLVPQAEDQVSESDVSPNEDEDIILNPGHPSERLSWEEKLAIIKNLREKLRKQKRPRPVAKRAARNASGSGVTLHELMAQNSKKFPQAREPETVAQDISRLRNQNLRRLYSQRRYEDSWKSLVFILPSGVNILRVFPDSEDQDTLKRNWYQHLERLSIFDHDAYQLASDVYRFFKNGFALLKNLKHLCLDKCTPAGLTLYPHWFLLFPEIQTLGFKSTAQYDHDVPRYPAHYEDRWDARKMEHRQAPLQLAEVWFDKTNHFFHDEVLMDLWEEGIKIDKISIFNLFRLEKDGIPELAVECLVDSLSETCARIFIFSHFGNLHTHETVESFLRNHINRPYQGITWKNVKDSPELQLLRVVACFVAHHPSPPVSELTLPISLAKLFLELAGRAWSHVEKLSVHTSNNIDADDKYFGELKEILQLPSESGYFPNLKNVDIWHDSRRREAYSQGKKASCHPPKEDIEAFYESLRQTQGITGELQFYNNFADEFFKKKSAGYTEFHRPSFELQEVQPESR